MLLNKYLKTDLLAGLVVFLVALPLCLGIALASGAPLFAGIISGVIGGIVVGYFSHSSIGVSGPAAGLATIVLVGIQEVGSFQSFLLAVIIAGCLQVAFGFLKFGRVAYFIPSSVIKGMLAAIGLLIILKQIPHLVGFDHDYVGDESFNQADGENTFSELILTYFNFSTGPIIIGGICLAILLFWESNFIKKAKLNNIPGSLICVLVGIIINVSLPVNFKLEPNHLVSLPVLDTFGSFSNLLVLPNWSAIGNPKVWQTGLVIAIVASIETLLSVEAADKMDPNKDVTPTNRELWSQGIGNILSGLIGGMPITQVIVRTSANVQSGGKTKAATIFHGIILLVSVLTIGQFLNLIPLAALAAILIMVGYKLTKVELFKEMFKEGQDQFVPFIFTVIAIVFSDLLVGVLIGIGVGIAYVIYTNFKTSISTTLIGKNRMIKFNKDVFFYNKVKLLSILSQIEDGESIFVDATKANFIDHDIFLVLKDLNTNAKSRNLRIEFKAITRKKINYRKSNAIVSETIISE